MLKDWVWNPLAKAYTTNFGEFSFGGPNSVNPGFKQLVAPQSLFSRDFYNPPTDWTLKKKPQKKGNKKKKEMANKKSVSAARGSGTVKSAGSRTRKRKRGGAGVSKSVKKYVSKRIRTMPLLGKVQTYKKIDSDYLVSNVNECAYHQKEVNGNGDLDYLMSLYRSTASTTAQDHRSFRQTSIKGYGVLKMHYRNNTSVPCDLRIYKVMFKDDTSDNFINVMTGRYNDADLGITGATAGTNYLAPNAYPSDTKLWRDHFKSLGVMKVRLNPGDEYTVTLKRSFTYNPDEQDIHAVTRQARKTCAVITRIIGVPAHDETVTTAVGYAQAGVDIIMQNVYKWRFVGLNEQQVLTGVDVHEGEGANTLDILTTPVTWGPNQDEQSFTN